LNTNAVIFTSLNFLLFSHMKFFHPLADEKFFFYDFFLNNFERKIAKWN
jgi:hypothetical protein